MNNAVKIESFSVGKIAFLDNVFDDSQWENIEILISEISREPGLLEAISKGQGALEQSNFSLYLYRFISRQNGISSVIDSIYTKMLMRLIEHSNLMAQISELAKQDLRILRMQLNIMREGGFVDSHIDYDSDNAYISSVMIQAGSEYIGGNFIIYDDEGKPQVIHRVNRSIMVMSSRSLHEVERIQKGLRCTICLFCG